MVYATQADVQSVIGADRLLMIADHNGDGTVDVGLVDEALANASALADSYLADYLPVPAAALPSVKRAVIDIAVNAIRLPRDQTTEDSRRAAKAAVEWFKDIQSGAATLPGYVAVDDGSSDGPNDPELYAEERVWTRSSGSRLF